MKYVIGIDLGTSSVKVILVDENGNLVSEVTKEYPLYQEKAGYSEQNPDDWVSETKIALKEIVFKSNLDNKNIVGISFSGQMHGLVLLDKENKPLRKAILWNDTRTTKECTFITESLGSELLKISKNKALEGFTLPKILWVRENENDIFTDAKVFLLPKDYLRYCLTGNINMEYSDAAGTLLLDVENKAWSNFILDKFSLDKSLCPPLVESVDFVGTLLPEVAEFCGLSSETKVFAGGADNACGAIGAGILNSDTALCSIGTSGVFLSFENDGSKNFDGKLHFFNHSVPNSFYIMGVTLSAGYSLSWFKETFAKDISFDELLSGIEKINPGSDGLLFSPYIMGERTPYADSKIRGSFIGISGNHDIKNFVRSVLEGITFSLRDSLDMMRSSGKDFEKIISIGGGAKNSEWLQMQADIFNCKVLKLSSEQGPALGAAMIAAVGCGIFNSFEECSKKFISYEKEYIPNTNNVLSYNKIYEVYKEIYISTKDITHRLFDFKQ